MTQTTLSRSVLETSTHDFKLHFREYLRDLAQDTDPDRVELIEALEWCFERWEHWRQKFYPEADLTFPFFQSMKRGSEFGHYSTMGSSGQPSVIHIKRAFLLGTSDITVWRISATEKLVLKADHPDRLKFVDATILHELVHQYMHEASPKALSYINESKHFGGHGSLFSDECNRINLIRHRELGFDWVPVRHTKTARAKVADRQRPSCAQFTHGDLFWCWDPAADELTDHQLEENRLRLEKALAFYRGAVVLVKEAAKVETDFPAPFDASCADVCIQQLTAYDQANGTDLVGDFVQRIFQDYPAPSAAPLNIPPAERRQMELLPDPVVPASADKTECPFQVGELVQHNDLGTGPVTHLFAPANGSEWNIAYKLPDGKAKIVRASDLTRISASSSDVVDLSAAYPVAESVTSLYRLKADIDQSGMTKAEFAQHHFGHATGQQLSRHLKKLRSAVNEFVAA